MPEAMFFYATVIKTEDEFCLIKKSNKDSQRGHLGTALKVAQPNFKPAPMVLIAPKHILWSGWSCSRTQLAGQLLQTEPATATLLLTLNYLVSKNVCLNCSHTFCSSSDTSLEKLRERLEIWTLSKSSHSGRPKHPNYSDKRMTLLRTVSKKEDEQTELGKKPQVYIFITVSMNRQLNVD